MTREPLGETRSDSLRGAFAESETGPLVGSPRRSKFSRTLSTRAATAGTCRVDEDSAQARLVDSGQVLRLVAAHRSNSPSDFTLACSNRNVKNSSGSSAGHQILQRC